MSENSHAGSVLAQLKQAEADDELPDELEGRLDELEGDNE
jgi:hypothetical protein